MPMQSFLHSGYRGSFLSVKQPGQKFHLRPVARLTINGVIPQLPLCTFIMWIGETLPLSGSKVSSKYETKTVGFLILFCNINACNLVI